MIPPMKIDIHGKWNSLVVQISLQRGRDAKFISSVEHKIFLLYKHSFKELGCTYAEAEIQQHHKIFILWCHRKTIPNHSNRKCFPWRWRKIVPTFSPFRAEKKWKAHKIKGFSVLPTYRNTALIQMQYWTPLAICQSNTVLQITTPIMKIPVF